MGNLTVFQFIEDFDNAELDHDDWMEQLEDAVRTYNEEYQTNHDPRKTVNRYINQIKSQNYEQ